LKTEMPKVTKINKPILFSFPLERSSLVRTTRSLNESDIYRDGEI
jgi:hypothetical protein